MANTDVPGRFPPNWMLDGIPYAGCSLQKPDETNWSLEMLHGGFGSLPKLLYARAVPYSDPADTWMFRKLKGIVSFSVSIGGPWQKVATFLRSVSDGESIGEASVDAGFPNPPSEIAELVPVAQPDLFATGSCLQETRAMLSTQMNNLIASSPSEDFPVVVSSLYRLSKVELFMDESGTTHTLEAHQLLEELTKMTGLDFTGGDLERLGNIEVFHLLGAIAHEKCQIQLSTSREGLSVQILPGFRPDGESLLVRCRQIAQGHVLRDELQPVTLESGGAVASFTAPSSGPSSAMIEVWVLDSGTWRIAWSHFISVCRKICMSLHVSDSIIDMQSDWLSRYATSRRLAARASEVQRINRFVPQECAIGDMADEPVVVSYSSSRGVRKSFFPTKSDAVWLEKMKGDVDEPRLELVEWFRDACSDGVSITILDPYFDSWGLELVTRLERSDLKVEILTTENDRDGSPRSLEKLKSLVGKMAHVLHRELRLLVTPKNQFHDRYLIIRKPEETVGYHLSNSLQHATKNHPLLITPIPSDAMKGLSQYAGKLATRVSAVIDAKTITTPTISREESEYELFGTLDDAINDFARAFGDEIEPAWVHLANHLAHSPRLDTVFERVFEAINAVGADNLVSVLEAIPLGQELEGSRNEGRYQNAVRWVQMPFADSLVDDDVERLSFEPLGKPWWLLYAVEFLADRFPKEFLAWFDSEGNMAALEDTSTYPRRQVVFALRHILLEAFASPALGPDGQARSSRSYASQFLRSGIPAIRASAARSVLEPFSSIEESTLSELDVLADAEQCSILEWVTSSLLWHVSENKVREEAMRALELVAERLVSKLSCEPDIMSAIERIAKRTSGAWHERVNKLLLDKATAKGVLKEESRDIWLKLLVERMGRIASDENEFFQLVSDSSLTEIAAFFTAKLPYDGVKIKLNEIEALLRTSARTLQKPFPRGRNYAEWSTARDLTRWGAAFGRLVLYEGPECEEASKIATAFIEKENNLLGPPSYVSAARFQSELDQYSCAVLLHVDRHQTAAEAKRSEEEDI